MPAPAAPATAPKRLRSIDVFRGATIAGMILVNSQFSPEDAWSPFAHAAWNGWTYADTIFPFFLFIVGVSMTLSTAARREGAAGRAELVRHAARRALLLFGCGVLVDVIRFPVAGFPFVGLRHLQLTGVLQKIAACYFAAFLLTLFAGRRGALAGIVALNLAYLGLLFLFPVPGCGPGGLTPACNFPRWLDETVLGRFTWGVPGMQDRDGLGALLPAISSVLFGTLAGDELRAGGGARRPARLLWGGAALLLAGLALSPWLPLNKPIWTPSYAVFMAGLAAMCLAASIWVIDVQGLGRWFKPLEILGLNAVAAYLVSRLLAHVPRVHVRGLSLYDDLLRRLAGPGLASLLFACVVLGAVWLVAWAMYRRRWFLKF